MIPAKIYSDTKSPGEIEIFKKLRDDPNTEGWIVLHSLDISHHVRQVAGEVDFVVIVPSRGVLCIEVKAANRIRREQGLWYYGSDTEGDSRGPFKQASEAMHSLRKRLTAKEPALGAVMFWSAVLFPYVDLTISSDEWHPWQVINGSTYRLQPLSASILSVLNKAGEHLQNRGNTWYSSARSEPTTRQCQQIAHILRPDFEFFTPPRVQIGQLETEVKKYTEEQFIALDAMDSNDRVVFAGPAGTGKTLLAVEAARRSYYAGRRVLFLCFNKHLGRRLSEDTSLLTSRLTVMHLHKYMLQLAGEALSAGEDVSPDYWMSTLPDKAVETLLRDDTEQYLFDELILDEAQDMLRGKYLDFLDLCIKGGLASGRWRFFGDFERQAIYESTSDITLEEALRTRLGRPTVFSLRVNCRNTPRVATLVELLGNLAPGYSRVLRPDDKLEPKLRYYTTNSQQLEQFTESLDELLKLGFSYSDIVVLSTRSNLSSIAHSVGGAWKSRLRPLDEAGNKHIRFGTIHSFKGLESPAVVVTDVDQVSGDRSASLFYVAMTRPLKSLTVLASSAARDEILRLLLKVS
jgi:DNA polymerase III delta prime subunit